MRLSTYFSPHPYQHSSNFSAWFLLICAVRCAQNALCTHCSAVCASHGAPAAPISLSFLRLSSTSSVSSEFEEAAACQSRRLPRNSNPLLSWSRSEVAESTQDDAAIFRRSRGGEGNGDEGEGANIFAPHAKKEKHSTFKHYLKLAIRGRFQMWLNILVILHLMATLSSAHRDQHRHSRRQGCNSGLDLSGIKSASSLSWMTLRSNNSRTFWSETEQGQ